MTSSTADIIRVRIEEGAAGLFYATSPDLKGLLAAAPGIDELEGEISNAVVGLYGVRGLEVVALQAERTDPDFHPWIAVPSKEIGRLLTGIGA